MGQTVDFQAHFIGLFDQFERRVHIAQSASWVGAATRDDIDGVTLRAHRFRGLFHFAGHVVACGKLFGGGTVEVIEQDVAVGVIVAILITGAIFEQDMAFEAHLGGKGGRLTPVVGLGSALRHDHICTLFNGFGHEEFQLAGLVSTSGHAGAIVTLDPQLNTQFF